ncbi:MAG: LytTR family transcriptional regulator DNA-binding domain-containing protein [Oscillospiraceae bacterium]|nr:LytTR family transcriptional regulator DNA-binding domain-containing protein [Oscillospiraceae bacterium]
MELEGQANRTNRDSYALYWLHSLEDLPGLTARCLHPVGFVLPPPDKAHVEAIFQRVFDDYEALSATPEEGFVTLQTGGAIYRLAADSIDYIEALDKKLNIWTKRQCLTVYAKIGQMEELLGSGFFRCHRSYLFNYSRLESVDLSAMEVCLQSGVRLPLSRSYRDELKNRMTQEGAANDA